jgi:hypothetical protein
MSNIYGNSQQKRFSVGDTLLKVFFPKNALQFRGQKEKRLSVCWMQQNFVQGLHGNSSAPMAVLPTEDILIKATKRRTSITSQILASKEGLKGLTFPNEIESLRFRRKNILTRNEKLDSLKFLTDHLVDQKPRVVAHIGTATMVRAFTMKQMITSDIDIALAAAYARLTNKKHYDHGVLPPYALAKAILSDSVEGKGAIREYSKRKFEQLLGWLRVVYFPEEEVINDEDFADMLMALGELFNNQQAAYHYTDDGSGKRLASGRTGSSKETMTFTTFSTWFREECEWILSQRHGDDQADVVKIAEEFTEVQSI